MHCQGKELYSLSIQQQIFPYFRRAEYIGIDGLQAHLSPNTFIGVGHSECMQHVQSPAHCDQGHLILLRHLRKRGQITAKWIDAPENFSKNGGRQSIPHLRPFSVNCPCKRDLFHIFRMIRVAFQKK